MKNYIISEELKNALVRYLNNKPESWAAVNDMIVGLKTSKECSEAPEKDRKKRRGPEAVKAVKAVESVDA